MAQDKKVTIGIGVRNGGKFLEYTLRNIFLNEYPPEDYEVVICNHGSTDNSEDIIKKYIRQYGNIKVINIPFEGINRSLPRNIIINNSCGEIIVFIDQDILVPDTFIREQVRLHTQFESCLLTGYSFAKISLNDTSLLKKYAVNLENITESYELLKSIPRYKDKRQDMEFAKKTDDYTIFADSMLPPRAFWTNNYSFKRRDLPRIGYFDEDYKEWGVEDFDYSYRFHLRGIPLLFSEKIWCYHIIHPVDLKANFVSWRKNLDYFFRKYPNFETEIYFIFGIGIYRRIIDYVEESLREIEDNPEYIRWMNAANPVFPPCEGRRLGLLHPCAGDAAKFNLTHCFVPLNREFLESKKTGECEFWSLIGLKTPFGNEYFDEAVIVLDFLLSLDIYILSMVLLEISRIAGKVIFCYSPAYEENETYEKEYLEQTMKLYHFKDSERKLL